MMTIHLTLVILTGLVVLYSDEQGFLWMFGKKPLLSHNQIWIQHALVSMGLASIVLTGGIMFVNQASYFLHDPTFLVKMVFVFALLVNGFLIESIAEIATQKAFKELTPSERRRVFISGAVSIIGWIGAGLLGLTLG